MKKKDYKRRCEKVCFSKCEGVCRTYNPIQLKYAYLLEERADVASFQCNVTLEGLEEGEFTTDFLCMKVDGDLMVRECVFRKLLVLPRTAHLLDVSRNYWLRHGVSDWGLVVDAEK